MFTKKHLSAGHHATQRTSTGSVTGAEIVRGIKERGMDMPVLLRLRNILDTQIRRLHSSFAKAIKQTGYQGQYRGVYPIKVNQQQQVVEEIACFGREFHHGFEAGSKAELIAAMRMPIHDRPRSVPDLQRVQG